MKKLIMILKLLLSYIIGNFVFNIVFSITEKIVADILSLHINFLDIYVKNTTNNLILYSILYFIIILTFYSINWYLVKVLNSKLERKKNDEKK